MKLDDAAVMAFPKKLVEHTILGLQPPLNRHLVKLVGFDFPSETRRHFRRETENWLEEIQSLRFKPNNRTVRQNSISTCCLITHSAGSRCRTCVA